MLLCLFRFLFLQLIFQLRIREGWILSGSTFSDAPLADAISEVVAISDEKRYIMGKRGRLFGIESSIKPIDEKRIIDEIIYV